MASKEKSSAVAVASIADREIVISRVFNAPRELVWDAWTDPKQVVQWWGPNGFTTTIHEMDVRPGGVWRHTMHGPDGTDYPNKSVFIEVVKPERIVYSHGGGRKGGPGVQFEATWTFEAQGDQTVLTLRQVFPSAEVRDRIIRDFGAVEGGKQTLGRLAGYLARTPIAIERTFNASVETVWKAITEEGQMKQWYFPQLQAFKPVVGFETEFAVSHQGKTYVHIWRITEVVPQRRIAYSWKYRGYPGDSVVTFELFPEGDKTRLRLTHTGLETFLPESHPELARSNFLQGWTHFMDSLRGYLEHRGSQAGQEFVISRTFDAPRDLVWKAFTDPESMKQWWGPKGVKVIASRMDLRPGGIYHYGMQTPDGHEMWGKFVYREIVPQERLVFVNSFSDKDGKLTRHPFSPTWPLEMLSIFTFTEHEGKTTLTIRWSPLNASEEERKTFAEGHASMQQGWTGTLDQLAAYLATA